MGFGASPPKRQSFIISSREHVRFSVAFGSPCESRRGDNQARKKQKHKKETENRKTTMAAFNSSLATPRDFDDDDDFQHEYFSRTYRPLSNLPTPPPSSRNSASCSPVLGLDDDTDVDSELLGMSSFAVPVRSSHD